MGNKYLLTIGLEGFILLNNLSAFDRGSSSGTVVDVRGPLSVEMERLAWTNPLHGAKKEVLQFVWSDYMLTKGPMSPQIGDQIGYPFLEFQRRMDSGSGVRLVPTS